MLFILKARRFRGVLLRWVILSNAFSPTGSWVPLSVSLPFSTSRIRLYCSDRSSSSSKEQLGFRSEEAEILNLSADEIQTLPVGIPDAFRVVQHYSVPESSREDWKAIGLSDHDIERVNLKPKNLTLPIALMLLDPVQYPSESRARKVCRKGNILVRPLSQNHPQSWNTTNCFRGRVGDRVRTGDIIGKQVRIGNGYFPILNYKKPPFDLPVLYEDDHFALVNKPAGVVVYSHHNGGHGTMTVRAALPFVLQPPKPGTYAVLRRPTPVHRLDKPTSGVLCIAKTKPAMVDLSRQFHDRVIQKTYVAIVNGIPEEDPYNVLTAKEAFDMGVDVDPDDENARWQLIDSPLDGKEAVTIWRAVRYAKSLHANDGILTVVELKPKTGRFHQLRRHMAWVCNRPLVGDDEYDEGKPEAMKFRDRGLFLCSSSKVLEHPFYNSQHGFEFWKALDKESNIIGGRNWYLTKDKKVMLRVSLELPSKFENLLEREEERYYRHSPEAQALKESSKSKQL